MPAGSARVLRWLAAAALVAAGAAHADFKEDYSRGLAALKDGNNAEARELLQKAMSAQPEAALRVRLYGQRWEPYLPQHYLGVAAFKMGDCTAALALWNSSENKQTIGQIAELQSEQQRDIAECSKTLVAKKEEPAPTKPAEPKPADTKPVDAKTTVATTKPPEPVASKPVEPPPKAADAGKASPPSPDATKLATAKPVPPPAAPVDATPSAPPDSLVAAFDKYLSGRYAEVAAIDPNGYRDARSRYHAFLLRAAARYTLSQVGGDESLAEGARDDVRAARAANAKGSPDATMFSPRFRTFFAQSR